MTRSTSTLETSDHKPDSLPSNKDDIPIEEVDESVPVAMALWSYPVALLLAACIAAVLFLIFAKTPDVVPTGADPTPAVESTKSPTGPDPTPAVESTKN